MDNLHVYGGKTALAEAVAFRTVAILHHAIKEHGDAVWVLSGGSTPLLAYDIIANRYANKLDWSLVTIVMGDERMGSAKSPYNNWHSISMLIDALPVKKIRPASTVTSEESAMAYEKKLKRLPMTRKGLPRLDLVWLGVGPDGHTLSLFPEHVSLIPSIRLVIPVHNSPKPPSDRISLTFRALMGAQSAMIIATGKDKKEAVTDALSGKRLPIKIAEEIVATHGERVDWFVDESASPK